MRRAGLVLVALAVGLAATPAGGETPASWSARQAAAMEEANRLLAGLALPSGAIASPTEPPGDGGALALRATLLSWPNLVEAGGWWIVRGLTPLAALDYVREHSPELAGARGGVAELRETAGATGNAFLGQGTGVIGERRLGLRAQALPDGSTGVRIDAGVLWALPRDPIPSGARLLRVKLLRLRPGRPRTRVLTVRRARRIAGVVRLVNSLPAEAPTFLVRSCPAGFGTIRLAFHRQASAPPFAVVTLGVGGCGGVSVTIRGKPQQPGLDGPELLARLERILARRLPIGR